MRVQAGAFLGGDSGILQTKSAYARSADSLVSAAMSPPSPTTVRPTPTTEEALSKGRKQKSNRGLLIEPWVYHEIVRQPVRERVKEAFDKIDTDASGCISAGELKSLCALLGTALTEKESQAMLKILESSYFEIRNWPDRDSNFLSHGFLIYSM